MLLKQKHIQNKVSIRQKRAVKKCQFRVVSESATSKMSIRVESTFDIFQHFLDIVELHEINVRRTLPPWGEVRGPSAPIMF